MQDETIINGLKQKRAELAGQLERVRKDLAAIDGALIAFGYHDVKQIPAKRTRRRPPLFKAGELMALVGEAGPAGNVQMGFAHAGRYQCWRVLYCAYFERG